MTIVADRYCVAQTLSEVWIDALVVLRATPRRKTVHLVLRIMDPTREDLAVGRLAQSLIDQHNERKPAGKQLWDVETTRNRIYPASWARRLPEPPDLAEYYRERYADLRKHPNNGFGTYFGRIVAYPREHKHHGQVDQLSELVRKVRHELLTASRKSSRYEVNVFSERHDTNVMSFPCLAHLSFHVHDGKIHLQAVYRNEVLVGRAYGNYLGLAQLLVYIAAACPPLVPGELLVAVNHVELDASVAVGLVDEVLAAAGRGVSGRSGLVGDGPVALPKT